MYKKKFIPSPLLIIIIFSLTLSPVIYGQQVITVSNATLDSKTMTSAVNNIAKLLNDNYVFPETAKKMEVLIKSNLSGGTYNTITDPQVFAETLTKDLQSVSHDKHLRIKFSPDDAKMIKEMEKTGSDVDDKMFFEQMKRENYGFKKVEILNGNIGYIDFRNFAPSSYSKETVASVMNFISGTDAIIFDIRQNGGGDPDGVRLICSYLFGTDPVHLNDIYTRVSDETNEYWTLKKVDGKKMPEVPVYVLTSNYTFSGAEEFAYDLKNQKRATIVGEVTGGGANPGGMMYVNGSFVMFVPKGRAINPITKTNWEGTGVQPDVEISSEKALNEAQILAMQNIASKLKEGRVKDHYGWMIESLQGLMNAPVLTDETMKSFAGEYGERTITFENGNLYYQRKGRPKFRMTAMGNDTFMFKDIDYFRIKFNKDSDGKISEVVGIYDDGHTDKSAKTN